MLEKPNNKFKQGDWVLNSEATVVFKVSDIKVYSESFAYSGDAIDGYFSEEDLIGFSLKKADIDEALAYLKFNNKKA